MVKPSLIEINVNTNETITIEIRTSIEALLTGINSQYKNTKDSPNAKAYDELRVLSPTDLNSKFKVFHPIFINELSLYLDNQKTNLKITSVNIPLPGYTKVPRTSLIKLKAKIPRETKLLRWHYPERFGNNAVRVRQIDEIKQKWNWSTWQWLRDNKESDEFSLSEVFTQEPKITIIKTYIRTGFEHIIPKGFDHLLFILGIFLFSSKLSHLVMQVTMFTLAHTITLGLSINKIINISPVIVEPLIAFSIAFIAFENIISKVRNDHSSNTYNIRLVIIFFFGLLHGLGFASMLSEFGMPDNAFYTSLISFNIGVEIAQLSIILLAQITLVILIKQTIIDRFDRSESLYMYIINIPISIIIGIIGLYWAIVRIDLGAINEIFS